jgi:RNA polymerase sigma-70 factor (ECF subfamily)
VSSPVVTGAEGGALDEESRAWIAALQATGAAREAAVGRLHELLLRATRFEVRRRRATLAHLRGDDLDDLAMQSAGDALVAVLAKLGDFRGASRFTTWAYKFALLEAAVALRRRAWQQREVPLEQDAWDRVAALRASPQDAAEHGELLAVLAAAIAERLTAHQREVLVATTLDGVPIDVLAERLHTTRGALYKTLHDARRKLRAHLTAHGLTPDPERGDTP